MKRTIKKVLDELMEDKPDLSYIRGMLEVLIDEEEPKTVIGGIVTLPMPPFINTDTAPKDEADILNAKAKANLADVMAMSTE